MGDVAQPDIGADQLGLGGAGLGQQAIDLGENVAGLGGGVSAVAGNAGGGDDIVDDDSFAEAGAGLDTLDHQSLLLL